MKRAISLLAAAALLNGFAPAAAWGGGLAHDANGMVYAPREDLAQAVLQRAGEYRRQIALEWLGKELPPSVGRVRIHVKISAGNDSGQTWAIDSSGRHFHTIWVTGSERSILGGLLKHEMTHAVLATQFPEGLPPALDEGIASAADDPQRVAIRNQILDWYAETDNWPRLIALLESRTIDADDQQSYAIASSLVEYLLTRGDKPTLLRFARSGKANGWDQALRMHYQIGGVAQLETAWKAWASQRVLDHRMAAGVATVR